MNAVTITLIWISSLGQMSAIRTPHVICPQPNTTEYTAVYMVEERECVNAPTITIRNQFTLQYENDNTINHPERD